MRERWTYQWDASHEWVEIIDSNGDVIVGEMRRGKAERIVEAHNEEVGAPSEKTDADAEAQGCGEKGTPGCARY